MKRTIVLNFDYDDSDDPESDVLTTFGTPPSFQADWDAQLKAIKDRGPGTINMTPEFMSLVDSGVIDGSGLMALAMIGWKSPLDVANIIMQERTKGLLGMLKGSLGGLGDLSGLED